MKKIKVAEASNLALDWLVAHALGESSRLQSSGVEDRVNELFFDPYHDPWSPSTNWAQGGPIAHRYRININYCVDLRDRNGLYIHAEMETHSYHGYWRGDHCHPLVAAMRCFVASKLGPEVEVPDELLES